MIQSYVTIRKTATVNKCCEASKGTLTKYNLFLSFFPPKAFEAFL